MLQRSTNSQVGPHVYLDSASADLSLKLLEHEISGDVLVEMDVNTLKEIDLHAFGRRVHINKGIKELRKMFEPPPAPPSSSQNAAYPSSASLTSPSLMSGYEPDSSSTPGMTSFPSANFRDSVNSSQNGQYALSQPGEHSQGASVDNQGHYRVHQKSAPSVRPCTLFGKY